MIDDSLRGRRPSGVTSPTPNYGLVARLRWAVTDAELDHAGPGRAGPGRASSVSMLIDADAPTETRSAIIGRWRGTEVIDAWRRLNIQLSSSSARHGTERGKEAATTERSVGKSLYDNRSRRRRKLQTNCTATTDTTCLGR